MSRDWRTLVVDCETTGLDVGIGGCHVAVEVAWCDLDTGELRSFIPAHDERDIDWGADPEALRINGYRERLAGQPHDDGTEVAALHAALDRATLAGSAPSAVDAPALGRLFDRYALNPTPWHHRLLDLGAYAMGVLGLAHVPGLAEVCTQLGVDPPDHTAEGDVRATVACFAELGLLARLREGAAT